MKVIVSKVMAKAIQNEIKAGNFPGIESAQYIEMTRHDYYFSISLDVWQHEIDYDWKKGMMKVIEITYPADYFAMPRYITTTELSQAFSESDKSYNGFFKALYKIIEI